MVDAYRAVRQFERLLGYKGPDYQPPQQPGSPTESGRLIATIVYDLDKGTERVERIGGLEEKTDAQ